MINCKEATRLVSQNLDRHLGFGEWLRLRLHLRICGACANFKKQVAFLRRALQRLGNPH